MLGVNADPSREIQRRSEEVDGITWRSWWDGEEAVIHDAYGIQGHPTVFLIDARGNIRFSSMGAPRPGRLEREIDRLLAEIE